jgi:3'(2'), 5'-bisphosphate nucleotidase
LAGTQVIKIYNTDFQSEYKNDKSPLTEADKKSHQIIFKALSQLTPDTPILSEEGKDIPYKNRKKWEYFWLVDPLDGTKEFIKKNGEFTINIALIYQQRPVLGVIYIPVKDTFYFAQKEIGSYKLINKERLEKSTNQEELIKNSQRLPTHSKKKSFTVVSSRSHSSPETESYIKKLKKQHGEIATVSAGSSLKFCLVAEGIADIYPRFGPTMEWDTAAGDAIVNFSGKKVYSFESQNVMKYNKEKLGNGWFIVK